MGESGDHYGSLDLPKTPTFDTMTSLDEADYEKFNMSFNELAEGQQALVKKRKIWLRKKSCSNYCILFMLFLTIVSAVAVALVVYYETREKHGDNYFSQAQTTTSPASNVSTTSTPHVRKSRRLPKNFYPSSYQLDLKLYIPSNNVTFPPQKNLTFDGWVAIQMVCKTDSGNLSVHANLETFTLDNDTISVTVTDPMGHSSEIQWNGYTYDEVSQIVTFNLASQVMTGSNVLLSMNYTGAMLGKGQLAGLFYLTYKDLGETKWMAVTQLESTDARRVLPCFDEPGFKANFTVSLTHPPDMVALSNEQGSTSKINGQTWLRTTFLSTPPMSTYLLAIAVGDFAMRETKTKRNIPIRIWTRHSHIDETDFALYGARTIMDYYEDYFQIKYPLSKMDMLASPQLPVAAMENWGLVTFREASVLYKHGQYIPQAQQRVAHEIAHEFAHQWFGNLVTMDWWDDLWLNEGFAKYMEFIGADVITNGSLHMDKQFVLICTQSAMKMDQLSTSHPIYVHVESSDDIGSIFDSISYKKGAAILKMLHNTIGPDLFRSSIVEYLKRYKYGIANHVQLWQTFTEIVQQNGTAKDWNDQPLNVTQYMNPWVEQMGFPVLTIKRTNTDFLISQERFLLDPNGTANPKYANNPYNYQWYVPIWVQSINNSLVHMLWLTPNQTVSLLASQPEFVLNPKVFGFYRVNYDGKTWSKLHHILQTGHTILDVGNRAQLIDDAMTLARAGQLPYATALDTLKYLKKEKSSIPWTAASDNLGFIRDMYMLSANNQYLNKLLSDFVSPIYSSQMWNSSSYGERNVLAFDFQKLILSDACSLGIGGCGPEALSLFTSFIRACANSTNGSTGCSKVPINLHSIVYCTGIASGSVQDWNTLWNLYANEQIAFESLSLLYGLSCSKRPWQLLKILDAGVAHTVIPQENFQYAVSYVGSNPVGNALMWNYMEMNWDAILKTFGHKLFGYGSLVRAATYTFNTPYQINLLKNFISTHTDLGTGKQAFHQALETATSNYKWMTLYSNVVIAWLKANTVTK